MDINIYYLNINSIKTVKELSALYSLVSSSRKKKIENYHFEKDKIRSLVAESILIWGIKKLGIEPEYPIEIKFDHYGKPTFSNLPIQFSLSHSSDYVICAISNKCVGIDIEKIEEYPMVVCSYFHVNEQRLIESFSLKKRDEVFYSLWTMKESFLKYTGQGLSKNLSTFEVEKENGEYVILENRKRVRNLIIKKLDIDLEYSSSICFQKGQNVKYSKISIQRLLKELK